MFNLRNASESLLDYDFLNSSNKAINRIVKPGDHVLDFGTASGLLSIFAAREGGKVFVVAEDKESHENLSDNIKSSGYNDSITIISPTKAMALNRVDVAIIGNMDTLLIADRQAKMVNALINKGIITSKTDIIPSKVTNFFEPVCFDFDFFDCNFSTVLQSRNPKIHNRCVEILGPAVPFLEHNFQKKASLRCHYEGRYEVSLAGWLNALKFTTVVHMTEGLILGPTFDFCSPIYVPVHQMHVKAGDYISIKLDYRMSSDYNNLKINVL